MSPRGMLAPRFAHGGGPADMGGGSEVILRVPHITTDSARRGTLRKARGGAPTIRAALVADMHKRPRQRQSCTAL